MFSINFEIITLFGGLEGFSVGRLFGLLYMGAIIHAKYRFDIGRFKYLFYILVAFIMIIMASSALHLNQISNKIIDFSLIQNVVLFFILLIHERNDPGILEKSIFAFVIGAIIFSFFYFLNTDIKYSGDRLTVLGDSSNGIGLRMAIASICVVYYGFFSGRRISKQSAAYVLILIMLLTVMIETGSRVSLISFVLMILLMLIFYLSVYPAKRIISFIVYSAITLFVLIPFLLSNEMIVNRLLASKEGDLSGRDMIWYYYIQAIEKSLFIGYGFSGFEENAIMNFGTVVSPHNIIIEILLYGGVAALIVFILFSLHVLFNAVCMYSMTKKYLGLVLLIPYLGILLSAQLFVYKLMWFILAFNCISLVHKHEKFERKIKYSE